MDIKKLKQNAPVFILWTFVYWGYLYYFFVVNWNFHIFSVKDWRFFSQQWEQGWVVQGVDQWIFILVALVAIPLWYVGLKLLLPIPYRKWVEDLFFDSIYKRKIAHMHKTEKAVVEKRPSYRHVRPQELAHGIVPPAADKEPAVAMPEMHPQPAAAQSVPTLSVERKLTVPMPTVADPFHLQDSLYSDEDHTETLATSTAQVPFENMDATIKPIQEDLLAIMQAQGEVFQNVSIKDDTLSYVAVGKKTIYLCQVDDAEGDWLADEDPFGSEAPLWFSDRSHRVSPVFELLQTQKAVESLLKKQQVEATCQSLLVKTQGVIINAEEMMPKWKKSGVIVCRSQSGGAAVLPSFTEAFPEDSAPSQAFVKKVKDALHLTAKKASASGESSKKTQRAKKPKG